MMSSTDVNELHKVWLKFLNTTKTDAGEIWLDTFLAKYLSLLCSPNINTNNSFSFQWKSSGNILAHQLLSDMYEICERVRANSFHDNDSVSEPFKKYLLEGRGWQILWALENIGIQNLLCLKDLIKLLILHVPVLLSLPVCASTIPVSLQRKPKYLTLNTCFILSKRNKNVPYNIDLRWPDTYVPKKKRNFVGKKRIRRKKIKSSGKNSSSSSGEDQVLFEPCAIPASQLLTLQKVNRINSTSVPKSVSDVDESDQDLPLFDSSLAFQVQDFQCYNISVIDYMHFILNMFQESAQLDRRNSEFTPCSASLILEFSLNTLKDIHNGRYAFHGWSKEDIDRTRDQLLKLVCLSATVTYSSLSYTGAPNENEVISTLLIISDEIISFMSDSKATTFVCNVIKGCLMLINNTIEICSGDYAKIICIIRTFSENGASLCYNVILSLDKEEENAPENNEIHIIVSLIKGIIIFLKYEKVSVPHLENYNADCSIKEYIHHHSDLFGSFTNCIDICKEPVCCIASMSCVLLKIFSLPISKNTSNEVLKHLKMCGICCCIDPGFVLKILFGRYTSFDVETQHLILLLLEKYLFPQLGLTLKNNTQCSHCSKRLNESDILSWTLTDRFSNQSQLDGQQDIPNQDPDVGSTFWSSFSTYKDLLNSSTSETLENIAKHLIQIFSDGAKELKSQLFVRVILPQFLLLSSFEGSLSSSQKIKSKCFLSILQIVLGDSSLSAVFINFKGMPALYPFLLISEFRQLSLNALKMLIFSEDELNEEFDITSSYSALTCVPASATFCNFLLENTTLFSQKLSLLLSMAAHHKTSKKSDVVDNFKETIHFVCDIWKCYKEVISNLKTDYFYRMSEKVFEAGYSLFIVLLKNLNDILTIQAFQEKPEVAKNLLLLVQSLLTICIKTQKEVSTKVAVLETVKSNLKENFPKHVEYQILLFDLVLKCCLSSAPVISSVRRLYESDTSVETLDGTISSDKDATDGGSYGESYAADTEGSSSCIFDSSSKYEVMHQSYIEHGEVVKMLFELILHFQKSIICDWIQPALFVLQNLIKLCQECELNKMVLCELEIPVLLLESFSHSLKVPEGNLYDFQKAALDLFVILAQFTVQQSDLRKIMDFFKSPFAPVTLLLKCLNIMVDNMTIHPAWSASFPCSKKNNSSTRMKKRLKTAYYIHHVHSSSNNAFSGWTHGALCFPLTEDTRWNAFNKGFGFSLWLKLSNVDHLCPVLTSESNNSFNTFKRQVSVDDKDLFGNDAHMLHLISIGSDKFLLELWYNSSDRDLIVKISNYNAGEVICLSKGVCKSLFQPNIWHHLAVNYIEDNVKSVISSRVQIVLDGTKENVFNLTYKRSGSNILNNCHLLLGHAESSLGEVNSIPQAYSIGSFMFFKGNVLTRDVIFYLSSLGPNITSITDCALQKRNMFLPKHNICQNVNSSVSSDIFMGMKTPSLDSVQNSILCSYSTEKADVYLVYPPVSRGFFPLLTGNSKVSTSQEGLHQRFPSELQALALGNVSPSQFHGFQCALQHVGGITNFLFLFAFVIEHGSCEKDSSEALNLILKLLNKNTVFAEDFIRIKGYELLTQMIISKKCTVSNDLFQVLQQNCLTYCVPNENAKSMNLERFEKPSVISNASIFSLMFNSVAVAKNTSDNVLSSLFSLLDFLLDLKFPNIHINVEQFNHAQILKSLLWLLKRNYVMAEGFFPVAVVKMIPPLMQKLLNFNFDEAVFKSICHFMLLLHKSSTAYVCHSRSAFFFFDIIDKLGCIKASNLEASSSSSIWYADEVDKYFPLLPSTDSKVMFKRASSYPDQPNIFSEKRFPKFNKMNSEDCLDTMNFSSEPTILSNLLSVGSQDEDEFSNEMLDSINDNVKTTKENEATEICIGLLDLINSFITNKSSSNCQISLQVIQPGIFIVLAYTIHSKVCVSSIKVLSSYLKEADDNVRNTFVNMKGFHLLSNQLYQRPFNSQVFDACFSIIFDSPLLSVNLSHLFKSKNVTSFEIMSWLPLLAMLPNADSDLQMCEKIILILMKFLQLGIGVIVDLLENGLCISISHLLIRVSNSCKIDINAVNLLDSHSCLNAIGNLLKVVSTELCSSKRSADFYLLCDVLHLFSSLERKCIKEYGPESHTVHSLRDCQCIMYQVVVELSKSCNFCALKTNSMLLNDKAVWELLYEFQESLGTFSTISVSMDDMTLEPEVQHTDGKDESSHRPDIQRVMLEIPMTEVVNRFQILLKGAAHFIIFKDPRVRISMREREFIKTIFNFCIKGLGVSMDKNINIIKTEYSTLMCCLKDCLKRELSSLLMSLLSTKQDSKIKEYVVEILALHPLNRKILLLVVFSISRVENFLIFLYDLLSSSSSVLKKNSLILFNIVQNLLRDSSSLNILKNFNQIEKLRVEWLQLWNEDRHKWIAEVTKHNEKMFLKLENLAREISVEALNVTEKVFEIQNNQRKSFMEELKSKYYEEASERRAWFNLVEQITHEKAIWHLPDSYPHSWELDPTEGPLRIRRRLKRCYINVDPRFLRPDYTDRLIDMKELPFLSLLMHQNEFPDSAAVLHKLHSHEQIEFTSTCKIVTAFEEAKVEILIGACCIHLIGEETLSHINKYPISESWPFDSIKEIVPRRYELQNNAFEIFLTNGLTYLIAFGSEREFQYIWRQLESHGLPCQLGFDVSTLTQLWREGSITNFEYLAQLNKLSGRSFNDLMQYPVFPFILADYANQYLNLLDPSIYRNLEKPVAVQHRYREQFYKDMYEVLKEQSCGPFSEPELPISGPYHYGSHYSNSGSVLHFLIRLLPYTYSFIKYQDNNFDIPDRAFHSVETSWQLVTKDSTSDVKELIPEFFFLPEFLSNKNGFDFGVRQSGIRVNDVLLPPWCKQNPRLFILIHRQALESEAVTKSIHNWIDLVFGYKQTGEAAINAINVFHPATYFGFDINQWKDPITKQALKVMIKTLGQMPKQLFSAPHPMVSLSLATLDLEDEDADTMEVVDTVNGLRWGDYVGSPSTGVPSLVWCRKQTVILGSFLPLLANYMFGLGENICLLLNQKKNAGSDISSTTYIMSAALVSWGHKDGIIRIKLCRDQPALPLLRENNLDPICLCASVPDCKELFIAHSSGLIYVYSLCLGPSGQSVSQDHPPLQLNAHSDSVTSIYICKAFSIFVSASKDGSVVIWDLNRLCYVRSLEGHRGAVQLVTVSDTLGDIASSSNSNDESYLKVHTINGEIVGNAKVSEVITAICYSTAPEGVSVNVIATGLCSGTIRLWSSWDLKPVREITYDRFHLPIKCLVFSADNQHLFASNENGTVAVWEKPSKGLTSVPRLLVFT